MTETMEVAIDEPPTAAENEAVGRPRKRILLFSDGTGNSSAKLFKTNVWRLYEAADLGPPTDGRPYVQVAYYDNGVGTSSFKPLAALGGIFGFGLKRNLLTLYRFLCRNYEDGAEIYAFGFSRGAFTIRLLVGLITQEGVIEYKNERELAYLAHDAYRAFAGNAWPNRWLARMCAHGIRRVRDGLLATKRAVFRQTRYADAKKYPADIQFVGVWDTVAAYGGPSVEITRGVDDWIWPLTMPNYELSPKVLKARHALSIDDKRDAFLPLLWDEVRERDVVTNGRDVIARLDAQDKPVWERRYPAPDRLQQVWFTGMHADVGGGYPDETLSYVSLLWMMGEADLALLEQHETRIRTMANAFGPIHNSRAGLGSYYRFQPRKICAYVNPADDPSHPPMYRDRILRDPEIARDGFPDHGLLTEVKIHTSVIARIRNGTDGYAPINLPAHFIVYPTDPDEEPKEGPALITADPHDETTPPPAANDADGDAPPIIVPANRTGDGTAWERVWDLVWWRRLIYFLTVFASLGLATMPLWGTGANDLAVCEDARCWGSSAVGLLDFVLPAFATTWTRAFSANVGAFLLLSFLVLALMGVGNLLENHAIDRARSLWRGDDIATPSRSPLQIMRESRAYQYFASALKWYILPFFTGMVLLFLLAYAALAIVTQVALARAERGGLCAGEGLAPREVPAGGITTDFHVNAMCTSLRTSVTQNSRYLITLEIGAPWGDAARIGDYGSGRTIPMTPDGAAPGAHLPWYMPLGAPLRRVILAGWFHPLVEIREPNGHIYLDKPAFTYDPATRHYHAKFTARRTGALSIFVNDAVLPFNLHAFYANNRGTARVTVTPADVDAETGMAARRE